MTDHCRYTFPRSRRIRRRTEFQHVFKRGRRFGSPNLTVIIARNDSGPHLGITVPKRFGNAASRNHIKRLIREAFRLSQHDLPAVDIICVPRTGLVTTVDKLQRILIDNAQRFAADDGHNDGD